MLLAPARPARADEPLPSLERMVTQHEDMDYPAAIATGKALLARGGNGPDELQRIYELLGRSMVVAGDEAGAVAAIRKLLALRPDYQVGDDVSPKIRALLVRTQASWAGRPGLTVIHRPPPRAPLGRELELSVKVVEDPEKMVHWLRLRYWLARDAARVIDVSGRRGDVVFRVPLRGVRPGPLRYAFEVLDENRNVLVRRGEPARLSVTLHEPEPPPSLAVSAGGIDLAALARQAEARRQTRRRQTVAGYATLGAGLACAVTAAVLYGVGAVQGQDAHDRYSVARTDDELLRYGGEVEAARQKLTAGHVLIGVGVAAVATSIYLLLTRPKVRPMVRATAGGAVLNSTF